MEIIKQKIAYFVTKEKKNFFDIDVFEYLKNVIEYIATIDKLSIERERTLGLVHLLSIVLSVKEIQDNAKQILATYFLYTFIFQSNYYCIVFNNGFHNVPFLINQLINFNNSTITRLNHEKFISWFCDLISNYHTEDFKSKESDFIYRTLKPNLSLAGEKILARDLNDNFNDYFDSKFMIWNQNAATIDSVPYEYCYVSQKKYLECSKNTTNKVEPSLQNQSPGNLQYQQPFGFPLNQQPSGNLQYQQPPLSPPNQQQNQTQQTDFGTPKNETVDSETEEDDEAFYDPKLKTHLPYKLEKDEEDLPRRRGRPPKSDNK